MNFETPAFSADEFTAPIEAPSHDYTPHPSEPITPAFTLNLEENEPEFSVDNSEPTILNLDDEPSFNSEPSFDEEYASALAELDLPTETNETDNEGDDDDFAPVFDDSAFNNAFGENAFSEPSFNEPTLNVTPDNAPHFENEPTFTPEPAFNAVDDFDDDASFDDEPDFEAPYSEPTPSPARPQPVHVEGF